MPCSRQVCSRADAGEHQQLGGIDRTGGEDHLGAGRERVGAGELPVHHVDAGAAVVFVERQFAGAQARSAG